MVSERTISYWVKKVNKDIGREDRNEYCIKYFLALRECPDVIFSTHKEWYLVVMFHPDMWGDLCLSLVSCYVKKNERAGLNFLKLQREIKKLANKYGARYTIQGSHLEEKYFNFLKGIGYKTLEMIKEN